MNVGWKEWTHNRHPTHQGPADRDGIRCSCSRWGAPGAVRDPRGRLAPDRSPGRPTAARAPGGRGAEQRHRARGIGPGAVVGAGRVDRRPGPLL